MHILKNLFHNYVSSALAALLVKQQAYFQEMKLKQQVQFQNQMMKLFEQLQTVSINTTIYIF